MLNKIKSILSYNKMAAVSIACALVIIIAGLSLGTHGVTVTTITGVSVIILCLALFSYNAYIAITKALLSRFFMCVGLVCLYVEYTFSVLIKINLNLYTSIFWCDLGILFIFFSFLNDQEIKLLFKAATSLLTVKIKSIVNKIVNCLGK